MPIKYFRNPSIGEELKTKGLGFATMRIESTKTNSNDQTIYCLKGGRFTWEGTQVEMREDFNCSHFEYELITWHRS